MNLRFLLVAIFLLGAAQGGSANLHADEPASVTYPQWLTAFSRDVLATDQMSSAQGPTWVHLSGDDTILATTSGTTLLLRRFAADGTVRKSTWQLLPPNSSAYYDVTLGVDPSDDALYILAGTMSGACQLLRVDDNLDLQWSMPAFTPDPYSNGCRSLQVLADGSALVMQQSTLSRISRSGYVLWVVAGGGDDFRVDTNDVIWAASSGGPPGDVNPQKAAVLRLDTNGTLLSSDYILCATCIASVAMSVDVLPDGSVAAGGGSGSLQPGFFARYNADGSRRVLVDTAADVSYARVTHDANGAIYVQAAIAVNEVRRIDPDSGAVLWAAPADDFVARNVGIVTTRVSGNGVIAIALDDAGNELWSRPLSTSSTATVSHGVLVDGNVEFLVQDNSLMSPSCGRAPRLVRLDSAGIITKVLTACSMPGAARVYAIDAIAGTGALANLGYRLTAFTPEGDERWQASTCEWCTGFGPGDGWWVAAALTADGGAWAVRWNRPWAAQPDGETSIQRIDAEGNVVVAAAAVAGTGDNSSFRLFGTPQQAVMLEAPFQHGVTWQGVRADGTDLGAHTYSIPDPYFHIDDARQLADGGVIVVVKGDIICTVGCPPRYVTLLRLGGDGYLRWRYQFPESDASIALSEDGSASAVLPAPDESGVLQLRIIDGDGQAGASLPLTTVIPFASPTQLAGPVAGRWLLNTQGGFPPENALWLLDATGHVSASHRDAPYNLIIAAGTYGYLLSELYENSVDVVLLDPVSLAPRTRFYAGGSGEVMYDFGPWPWRLLDDGSVYGTLLTQRGNLGQMGLARYSVPGSPPSDLLFRDGYD